LKILVTGGAGFIGSHIVDALLEEDLPVTVIDNLSTGFGHNINPKAEFHRIDINSKHDLHQVFKLEKPDIVIHQAAQTVVTRSLDDPIFDARTNIMGSLNILKNCVEFKVNKVVYASSSAIYGTPQYVPVDENHALNPISPYGVSKQTVEGYLHVYHKVYGVDYCALRYSNVYGPRQNSSGEAGIVAIFTHQMLAGIQPNIYGDGSKTRGYVYVSDIVRANILAMKSDRVGVYNIGTSKATTDQQIFDMVSSRAGYSGVPRYQSERPGEIRQMCLDSSRAYADLGWVPEVELEEGISRVIAYQRYVNQTECKP
jgi:UDP-glucose 4-epimerase